MEHALKETDFLRLKRTRLGLGDFEMLKVIGRGAFGEVSFDVLFIYLYTVVILFVVFIFSM